MLIGVTVALVSLLIALLVVPAWAADEPDVEVPQLINYQGYLTDKDTSEPITGSIDITFSLYDLSSGGSALWAETQSVSINDGLFNILLGGINPFDADDFSGDRWLGIRVDTDPEMTPRQQITSVAFALVASEANNANTRDGMDSDDFGDGHSLDAADGSPTDAVYVDNEGNVGIGTTSPAAALTVNGEILRDGSTMYGPTGAATHINLGVESTTGSDGLDNYYCTVGGGLENTASGYGSVVGGGGSNTTSGWASTVSGGQAHTASGGLSTIGGGSWNTADGDYSTVGGGEHNVASWDGSVIGGGAHNTASDDYSTVGGGYANDASNESSTVGGGLQNTASGYSSTVGGGELNSTSGSYSTVGGGYLNTASGVASTVGGGSRNTAAGDLSWAGGRYMSLTGDAYHTFVWGYADSAQSIATPNAFLIFPSGTPGRVGIGTSDPNSTLHLDGSFAVKRTPVSANTNSDGEVIIGITDTSVPRTITLDTDDVQEGRIIIIKDESGGAGSSNITVDTEGAETIDGANSWVINTNYGVLRVYSDGTNWFTF